MEGKRKDSAIFPPTPIDDDYHYTMEPVYDAHEDLEEHYNNLHGLVQDVVTRNAYVMSGKFMSRVKREEEKLADLLHRVKEAHRDIEHNPTVDSVARQIAELRKQEDTMAKRAEMLLGSCEGLKEEAETRKREIDALREELGQVNKDNMLLSYQIDDLLQGTDPGLTAVRTLSARTLVFTAPSRPPAPVVSLQANLRTIEAETETLATQRGSSFAEQLKWESFFQSCLQTAKKELLKSQELPQDSKGLQGSLYFELLSSRNKAAASHPVSRSNLQERDYKNVVYYTVKRMISTAKDERKQQQLAALDIPAEQFRSYSPMQVIGLLALRADVEAEVHGKVFPANVLRVNAQGEGMQSATRLPALPKVASERYIPPELRLGKSRIGRELREKHSVSIV